MQDNTRRFSNRVEDYVKYRPHYPPEILTMLEQQKLLYPGVAIADIGSGTGISAGLFLQNGYAVWGVEPNREMRLKSEVLLRAYPHFKTVEGTAEATTLPGNSIDLIIAGQAFHWFHREECRREFKRILKPGGTVALIWNERLTDTAFEKDYEQLIIRHGNQYRKVDHRNIGNAAIEEFFFPQPVTLTVFDNQQVFNYEALEGRLLSSSYMPAKTDPGYPQMAAALQTLFEQFQDNGHVTLHYATKLYLGQLT
ncbi:class I SAM-dependent methyltransferase [Niabella drilacis]|uniref:Methyltransferase domain-containing protein n=1 Tax=Niabella drilacis (strain DSM 25811 / CCM 8410 / CCUG 62505 / LMG 26954 / E90) TaxID=1285928 RepID=A0A1G6WEX9_NIADE|nr:class I SAM-dependent methyltransferase [Niabella drilacis]SDD64283.1 Methyltransferase domain-containing protein [Niabella drilacis]